MDFDFTDREEAFRKEVRGWLEANLPDDLRGRAFASSRADREEVRKLRAWQKRMCEAGYVGLDWPREFGGRGATIVEMVILYQEMARAESPQLVNRGGVSMLGPTLMKHGTAAQQQRHLAKILAADELWCQGFSEPNAGSDLANLQTRAVREGEHFVVNGQKVWTSMAHVADWCFLLVRTDPAAVKHKGISFLLVDMKTPGITVRPLRQLTGEAEFNEVFFDNVRVPVDNLVGKLNEGWSVAITTLAYERDILTFIRHISLRNALHRLVRLVRQRERGADPIIRQKVAALWIAEQALQLNGYRSLTKILRGGAPGPEGSTSKLFWSQVDQELAHVATEVIGPYSQVAGESEWAPDGGQWEFYELLARASGIRAGEPSALDGKNTLWEGVHRVPKTLETVDKPVIAMVNGLAVGAGMGMCVMCDMRVAAESARFSTGYVRVGLVPGDGDTYFLPRLVGAAKALELLWTADFIEAPEAHRLGIVQRLAPDAQLREVTYALARQIADGPQIPIRMIKRLVYQSLRLDLRTHLDLVSSHMSIVRQTADHAEGVAAFKEKRSPKFAGH